MRKLLVLAALLVAVLVSCTGPEGLLEGAGDAPHWIVGPLILLATLSSEDLACVTAGILVSRGIIPFWYACFWCWFGIFSGDIGLYVLGRVSGERAAQTRLLRRFLTPKRLRKGEHMFKEHGAWVLFSARFLPGSRMPAFIAAGILKFPIPKFALFLALAGLLWTPAIVGMAHWWGSKMDEWLDLYEKYVWLATLLTAVMASITIRIVMPFFSERGRLLMLSSFYRAVEWEFWPPGAIYLSLLPYALWQALKARHPLAFTAANPVIPHSGLGLESKSEILQGLCQSPPNQDFVARWKLIPPGPVESRLQELCDFQGTLAQAYPVVIRPDAGEHGQGVLVVHSEAQAADYLQDCSQPVIAQEHVAGLEFGVFYYRLPGRHRGEILSITRKQLLSVIGNGHSDLEELILHHPRALRIARFFLRQHQEQLDRIPARGEIVLLGEVGSHCRGALFADARDLKTEALRAAIDAISQRFEGFYIGRFDVRVPAIEDLQSGKNLKIVDLNGISAEVAHIDQGYRELAKQWRLAYQIGAANRKAGHPVTAPGELLRLAWRSRRSQPSHPCARAAEKGR